jgi:hypothetical protein
VPKKLGRGAALAFNEIFWTEFLADHTSGGTFFPTNDSKSNYISGATAGINTDSRMNIDGVSHADYKLSVQTDPNGNPLGSPGKILLVPNSLKYQAWSLVNSTESRDTTANTKQTIANPHAGKFTVVASPSLSNASMGGAYSTAFWYLLTDPADIAFIETAFLNGVENPTLDNAEADFNTLGIKMRGFHDFGVNKQEYRAAVKSKGAA